MKWIGNGVTMVFFLPVKKQRPAIALNDTYNNDYQKLSV